MDTQLTVFPVVVEREVGLALLSLVSKYQQQCIHMDSGYSEAAETLRLPRLHPNQSPAVAVA